MKNNSILKSYIMRRVWYSYALSVILSVVTLLGMVFGASTFLFLKLVSINDILNNLLEVKLGVVPIYVWQVFLQAISQGEFLTLVSLGLIIFSLLSFKIYLTVPRREVQFG
jgi:hypothetical protein